MNKQRIAEMMMSEDVDMRNLGRIYYEQVEHDVDMWIALKIAAREAKTRYVKALKFEAAAAFRALERKWDAKVQNYIDNGYTASGKDNKDVG